MTPLQQQSSRDSGFTLIELSIVLVIIGLVVGGIFVGRDLIRQAELRSIMSDGTSFKSAVNTFRLKYDCLPGDCTNAEDYFGTDSSGCAIGGGATGTCNGNGNAQIEWALESFRAWQQLGMAGLISGFYSGISDETVDEEHSVVGWNIPASKINSTLGYQIEYSYYSGDTSAYWGSNPPGSLAGNRILVGLQRSSPFINNAGFLTPQEAYSLDVKYDDGNPTTGTFTTLPYAIYHDSVVGQCVDQYTVSSKASVYYLSYNQPFCAGVFNLGM